MREMRAVRLASNGLRTRVRLSNTESNWRWSSRWGTTSWQCRSATIHPIQVVESAPFRSGLHRL